jgi:hypothetical protein
VDYTTVVQNRRFSAPLTCNRRYLIKTMTIQSVLLSKLIYTHSTLHVYSRSIDPNVPKGPAATPKAREFSLHLVAPVGMIIALD